MIICFLHPYPKQRHTASSDTLSPRRAGSQLSWLYRWPLNIGSGKSAQRLGIWCSENKGYGIYITAIRSASSITTNIVTEKIAVNALMIFSFIFRFSPWLKAPNIPSVNKGKYAWQRAFSVLFALFALTGASPPALQKTKTTRKFIADKLNAVVNKDRLKNG